MAKSRRRSQRRRRSRKKRGKGIMGRAYSAVSNKVGIGALVARYIGQLLKKNTDYPKTRQLMLDSFVYAALVAKKAGKQYDETPLAQIPEPKYGVHTYTSGQPVKGGSGESANIAAAEKAVNDAKIGAKGGRRRRSRKKRRKSRRKSKRKKSRRRRKKSRRRRRR
tara:strand:+ start:1471 stop:1965 length:495 start_codon:yes stop_codon:yes gene_type:complete